MNTKKNYILNLSTNWITQFISILLSFISIPLMVKYFGNERYGLWSLINTFIIYVSISGLGINSAASTLIIMNNNKKTKIDILNKAFKLSLYMVIPFLLIFITLHFVYPDWINILGKIDESTRYEASFSIFIYGFFILLNLPLEVYTSSYGGFGYLHIKNIFDFSEKVISFFMLLIVIYFKLDLIALALTIMGSKTIHGIFKLFLLRLKNKNLKYNNNNDSNSIVYTYKDILNTGLRYVVIGFTSLLVWNTDNLVISNFLGFEEVTSYSVTFRLYTIASNIIAAFGLSLLPELGTLFGDKKWDKINKNINNIIIIYSFLGGMIWICGSFFFWDFIQFWTKKVVPDLSVIVILGSYIHLLGFTTFFSGILRTFNFIKKSALISLIEGGSNLLISIILLHFLGISGIALGTLIGHLLGPFFLIPLLIKHRSEGKIYIDLKTICMQFLLTFILVFLGLVIYKVYSFSLIVIGIVVVLLFGYINITLNKHYYVILLDMFKSKRVLK